MELLWVFMDVLALFLLFIARTKSLLFWFKKVFGCLFVFVSDGWYDFSNNTHTSFTIQPYQSLTTFNNLSNTQINSHTPSLHSMAGHPYNGGIIGTFMQLHKVLILLCICTLTQKFTFLCKSPKSLKDKLFCSFNEVFVFVEIFWVLIVITWSSGLLCFYKVTSKVCILQYRPMLEVIAFRSKLVENKIVCIFKWELDFHFILAPFKTIL